VEALKARLQFDINQAFSWKHGLTARLEGQNRKLDACFVTANDGVRLAKLADVSAGDAMTRANDAMKQAEEALKRAKNVFNTAVNDHGPSLRKIKDRITSLENKVEELDRDTRAMSRTLISGGASAAASGSGEISDLRSDMRRLQRDADDLYATTHSSEIRIDGAEAAHNALKAQVEALAKELAAEKAKVAYLVHRDYASSMAQPQVQQQQQPQQQQAHSANVGYPLPYPMPSISASARAIDAAPYQGRNA
jgi:chromosome segregation ATPase